MSDNIEPIYETLAKLGAQVPAEDWNKVPVDNNRRIFCCAECGDESDESELCYPLEKIKGKICPECRGEFTGRYSIEIIHVVTLDAFKRSES